MPPKNFLREVPLRTLTSAVALIGVGLAVVTLMTDDSVAIPADVPAPFRS